MKRFLTALALGLAAIFVVAGCNDYGNTFQANTGAQITTLSPSNITAGSGDFTLTINGSGFVTQTYITWNNTKLTTSDITDSAGDVLQVYATVPASLVAASGKALIITHNPFSGAGNNGLSNPLNFIINSATAPNPQPLIASISPTNVNAGSAPFALTITGSNFLADGTAKVSWNSGSTSTPLTVQAGTTTTATQIVVSVPASLVTAAGTASVDIVNPPNAAGGGGTSNLISFQIVQPNPVPTVQSISPSNVDAGSAAFSLTLTGTNFLTTASTPPVAITGVFWISGGVTTPLASASSSTPSSTQLVVTVPATLVTAAGTATIVAQNPPTAGATSPAGGGGNSSPVTFTINTAGGEVAKAQAASEETPAVSADGRYVAYTGTQGQNTAIFFRDTCEGAEAACQERTSLVSVATDGTLANEDSHTPSMSADGRYVAFASAGTNLVLPSGASGTTGGSGRQIYLRDTCTGAAASCVPSTELVSTDASGQLLGTEAILPSVSASGRFVAFVAVALSKASNGATPAAAVNNSGYRQVFVRDTCLGATSCTAKTTRISLQPGDGTAPSTTVPAGPALSGDAKKIALTGSGTAVLFTRSVAVDDRVFVAAVSQSR